MPRALLLLLSLFCFTALAICSFLPAAQPLAIKPLPPSRPPRTIPVRSRADAAAFIDGKAQLVPASAHGDIQLVAAHIDAGASIDTPHDSLNSTSWGRTALGEACAHRHIQIVTFLLSVGADLNTRSMPYGRSALQIAADTGDADIVRLLLQHGADANLKNDRVRNSTPLHWASSKGHVDIIKLLLQAGADVNEATNDNRTPLHWAAYWGQVHALEALLDAGANFHLRDKKGKTPLSYAVQQQQEAAAAFLRQRGSEQYLPQLPHDVCFCFFFCFLQCYHAFFVVFDWAATSLCVGISLAAMLMWHRGKLRAKKGE